MPSSRDVVLAILQGLLRACSVINGAAFKSPPVATLADRLAAHFGKPPAELGVVVQHFDGAECVSLSKALATWLRSSTSSQLLTVLDQDGKPADISLAALDTRATAAEFTVTDAPERSVLIPAALGPPQPYVGDGLCLACQGDERFALLVAGGNVPAPSTIRVELMTTTINAGQAVLGRIRRSMHDDLQFPTMSRVRHKWVTVTMAACIALGLFGVVIGAHDLFAAWPNAKILGFFVMASALSSVISLASSPLFRAHVRPWMRIMGVMAGAVCAITLGLAIIRNQNGFDFPTSPWRTGLLVLLCCVVVACAIALLITLRAGLIRSSLRLPAAVWLTTLLALGQILYTSQYLPLSAPDLVNLEASMQMVASRASASPTPSTTLSPPAAATPTASSSVPASITLQNSGGAAVVLVSTIYRVTGYKLMPPAGSSMELVKRAGYDVTTPDRLSERLTDPRLVLAGRVAPTEWILEHNEKYSTTFAIDLSSIPVDVRPQVLRLDVFVAYARNDALQVKEATAPITPTSQTDGMNRWEETSFPIVGRSWIQDVTRDDQLDLVEQWFDDGCDVATQYRDVTSSECPQTWVGFRQRKRGGGTQSLILPKRLVSLGHTEAHTELSVGS